jgi:hypothetical protein
MADEMVPEQQPELRSATQDMGEALRTYRLFLSLMKWTAGSAALLFLVLLLLKVHG